MPCGKLNVFHSLLEKCLVKTAWTGVNPVLKCEQSTKNKGGKGGNKPNTKHVNLVYFLFLFAMSFGKQ